MKLFISICASLSCIFTLLFFNSCTSNEERAHSHEKKQDTLFVFQVDDVDSVFFHHGLKCHIRSRLENDSVKFRDSIYIPGFRKYFQRRDTLAVRKYPHGITITITSDTTKDTTTIKAGYARFQNIDDKTFEFSGDVQLISKKYALFTEQLTWNLWKQEYDGKSSIKVITPQEEITGSRFHADEVFSKFEIGDVKGVVKVK
jgi:hypothetical protein